MEATIFKANTKPVHAAFTSNAVTLSPSPNFSCTIHATDGVKLSGVIVAQTIKSISFLSIFEFFIASKADLYANSLVFSSEILRSLIPVL